MSPRDLTSAKKVEKEVYGFIRACCEREPSVQKAILFGSRARGDNHDRSDFDIAIEAPGISDEAWARLALELREKVPTLCGLDLVRLESGTAPDLSGKIKKEGIDLYVKR